MFKLIIIVITITTVAVVVAVFISSTTCSHVRIIKVKGSGLLAIACLDNQYIKIMSFSAIPNK